MEASSVPQYETLDTRGKLSYKNIILTRIQWAQHIHCLPCLDRQHTLYTASSAHITHSIWSNSAVKLVLLKNI